jgi:hypothetical protein
MFLSWLIEIGPATQAGGGLKTTSPIGPQAYLAGFAAAFFLATFFATFFTVLDFAIVGHSLVIRCLIATGIGSHF